MLVIETSLLFPLSVSHIVSDLKMSGAVNVLAFSKDLLNGPSQWIS